MLSGTVPALPLSPAAALSLDAAKSADRAALVAALETHRGNVRATAGELGVSEDTIARRLRAWGLADWHRVTYPRSGRQPARNSGKSRASRKSTGA